MFSFNHNFAMNVQIQEDQLVLCNPFLRAFITGTVCTQTRKPQYVPRCTLQKRQREKCSHRRSRYRDQIKKKSMYSGWYYVLSTYHFMNQKYVTVPGTYTLTSMYFKTYIIMMISYQYVLVLCMYSVHWHTPSRY